MGPGGKGAFDLMRLLLITAEEAVAERLTPSLARRGIEVLHAGTVAQGLKVFRRYRVDVVVLDANTPDANIEKDGQRFRRSRRAVAFMLVSEDPPPRGRFVDFHFAPPITVRKLMYRVRRYVEGETSVLRRGDVTLDLRDRRVTCGGKRRRLTPKLCDLLMYFMQHPGKDLSRKEIMQSVWDTEYVGDTRTLDVHVHWLRRALEPEPKRPTHILTVRGVGYRFEPGGPEEA